MLTAEQMQQNYNDLFTYIGHYFEGDRKKQLVKFYKKHEERLILLPASHKESYHSSFPGGYIFHVLSVIKNSLKSYELWKEMGSDLCGITPDNVVFVALNHDLGKMGNEEETAVFPSQDAWRKKNLGENYKFNTKLSYMTVPDRSLYLLSQNGIEMTEDEWIAIKTHDGLYDESNKSYYKSFIPENRFRTPLALILHEADMRAARIEFEHQYLPKIGKDKLEASKKDFTLNKTNTSKQKALSTVKSAGLKSMLDNL